MKTDRCYRRMVLAVMVAIIVSGCAAGRGDSRSLVKEHENASPSVELSFRVLEELSGGAFRVGIAIRNPRRENITSVRSWVRFDAGAFSLSDLRLFDERFSFVAPGEWEIAPEDGLVKIGVAAPAPVRDEEILLTSFLANKSSDEQSPLTFHDWRADGQGHTAVLEVLQDGEVRQLLLPPVSLVLP